MPKAWSDYALYSARRAHPIVDCRSTGDGMMRTLPLTVSAVADEDLSRQSRLECSGSWRACGYALVNAGHDRRAIQDWLGHRAIQHTTPLYGIEPGAV
jgi:hypothetical protein